MTNFEKFKKELTVKKLAEMLYDGWNEDCCNYCAYNSLTCFSNCECGIKNWLESEVE